MSGKHFYTDEKNAQIVIALLKAHGIRKVIANPGTTNIAIVGSVQNDPWFQVYSGIDERHSAYMAVGMAAESGEPVVLSCTGATASRNYLSALTEAYYRKLPILAVTSMQNFAGVGQLYPQAIDRSVLPRDVVRRSFELGTIKDFQDETVCVRKVNEAILDLRRDGGGPVLINLEMGGCMTFNTKELPNQEKLERFTAEDTSIMPELPMDKKIILFLGSGMYAKSWRAFASKYNVVVIADQSVSYDGPNRVSAALLCWQKGFRSNPQYETLKPDLIISAGEVSGDYPVLGYLKGLSPIWRVSSDGEIRSQFGVPQKTFQMSAQFFVRHYAGGFDNDKVDRVSCFASTWRDADAKIRSRIKDLPFSNPWIAKRLSAVLDEGVTLHLGILNSLRAWNFFPAKDGIDTFSNVGGFGIDGGVSTLIGASLARPDRLHFGVFGDLAFFYDLNSLGNRHIGKNLRILVVNNGCGTEFNMYFHPGSQFGNHTNDYIAAGRHFGNKNKVLLEHYAKDLGFEYLQANNKDEFDVQIKRFLSDSDRSIIFECFTEPKLESEACDILQKLDPFIVQHHITVKDLVPKSVKDIAKTILRR